MPGAMVSGVEFLCLPWSCAVISLRTQDTTSACDCLHPVMVLKIVIKDKYCELQRKELAAHNPSCLYKTVHKCCRFRKLAFV